MHIIAGKHRHQTLVVPKSLHIRPTSSYLRECLFNICQGYVEACSFLDLFAGCGAMGLEALSRGADQATFVDNHPLSIKSIRQNIQKLNEQANSRIIFKEAFEALELLYQGKNQFDIVYADPPYHLKHTSLAISEQILAWMDEHPSFIRAHGFLFLEDAKSSFDESKKWLHFQLKSARSMGGTLLRQYSVNSI